MSRDLTTEPKTTRLSVRAAITRSTGTLWMDDVSVCEVTAPVYASVEGRAQSSETMYPAMRGRSDSKEAGSTP